MAQKIRHIFLGIMALLLLASTTSWKVGKHYCMGRLVDVAFFVDVQGCGMDMGVSNGLSTSVSEKSCCADEVIVIEGQDNVATSFFNMDLGQQHFTVFPPYFYIDLLPICSEQNIPNSYYIPQKIVKDIGLLNDVFLI